jgi:ribonuclease E
LLELSRQRLRPALSETTHINCPRCGGMGTIRGVESMSLALLRLIGEEARKERTGRVVAQVPVDVATYLMNEKREQLNQIEERDKVSLVIVPNPHLQTPAYTLRRVRDDEKELPENSTVSYQLADQPTVDDSNIGNRDKKPPGDVPLVPSILPASTAPIVPMPAAPEPKAPETVQVGALVRFWRWLFGDPGTRAAAKAAAAPAQPQRDRPQHRDARHDRYRSGGDRDRNRDRGDRDRNRDIRRDGPRDPRRDGRPRGEGSRDNRHESGARRSESSGQPERNAAAGPRSELPRQEQPPRQEQAPRQEHAPRTEQPPRGNEGERSPNERGERSERGGRSRRRRGRGRRDGGENAANGSGANQSPGQSTLNNIAAPNESRTGETPSASTAPSTAPAYERPPERPAFEAPREQPAAHSAAEQARDSVPAAPPAPARTAEPAAASTGTDNKYVVWSSAPTDVQRSGPDER